MKYKFDTFTTKISQHLNKLDTDEFDSLIDFVRNFRPDPYEDIIMDEQQAMIFRLRFPSLPLMPIKDDEL